MSILYIKAAAGIVLTLEQVYGTGGIIPDLQNLNVLLREVLDSGRSRSRVLRLADFNLEALGDIAAADGDLALAGSSGVGRYAHIRRCRKKDLL